MSERIEFTVYGPPIPKGSTRAFMRPGMKFPIVTHANAKTKPWQESVVAAAREVLGERPPLAGAVALYVHFFLPRPQSAPRRVVEPIKKPDLDKLLRAIKDGLTRAGVYRDDAQVVFIVARKAFAGGADDLLGARGGPRACVGVEMLAAGAPLPAVPDGPRQTRHLFSAP